jgi:hypothetical protein
MRYLLSVPGGSQRQVPLGCNNEKWLRGGIDEIDRLTYLLELSASLEEGQGRQPIESRGEPHYGRPAIEKICGDRLRHHSTPRGDLVEIQVLKAMFEEQGSVPILQIGADLGLDEVDQIPVEDQSRGNKQVLLSPPRSHRRRWKIRQGIHAERVGECLSGDKVGTQVGENLPQRGLRVLRAIDGAEPAIPVVESVVPGAQLVRRIRQWIGAMPDPPKLSPAHPSKLTSCLAAALTSANCVGSVAWRRTSTGAASSRRVLVPKSQARAVLSSKLSAIMRTIL